MESEEREERLQMFFGEAKPVLLRERDLADALYSISESSRWPDYVDSVSEEQAIMCWRIVEKLRASSFPEDLRM